MALYRKGSAERSDGMRPGQAPAWLRRIHESSTSEAAVVFCPARELVVPLEECRNCGDCRGLFVDTDQAPFLRCALGEACRRVEDESPEAPGDRYARPPSSAMPAALWMSSPVFRVRSDWQLGRLAALFLERDISASPVVDDMGRAVGVVSKTDLLEFVQGIDNPVPGCASDSLTNIKVEDVMTHLVFAATEQTPIGQVAALMAYERVHHIVVVNKRGEPVGMLSSLDLLARFAEEDGFVAPKGSRGSSCP